MEFCNDHIPVIYFLDHLKITDLARFQVDVHHAANPRYSTVIPTPKEDVSRSV